MMAALAGPPNGLAAPLTVTRLEDGVPGSLREAIAASPPTGGTINFSVLGTIKLTSQLEIGKNLTIIGPGTGLTVSGDNKSRVFAIAPGATVSISGLTIANGYEFGSIGGGIYNGGTLTVSNCTIWYNGTGGDEVSAGGGIFGDGFGPLYQIVQLLTVRVPPL